MSIFTKYHFDFENLSILTNPRRQLELEGVALGIIFLPQGQGYTFTHSHTEQEEVYIVVEGRGLIYIDEELIELNRGDIVRVSPAARRALRASDESSLFCFCAGAVAMGYPHNPNARYLIDDGMPHYDDIPPWCAGDPKVIAKNQQLQERMDKAREKRESE